MSSGRDRRRKEFPGVDFFLLLSPLCPCHHHSPSLLISPISLKDHSLLQSYVLLLLRQDHYPIIIVISHEIVSGSQPRAQGTAVL
jgi:hypothetical protein